MSILQVLFLVLITTSLLGADKILLDISSNIDKSFNKSLENEFLKKNYELAKTTKGLSEDNLNRIAKENSVNTIVIVRDLGARGNQFVFSGKVINVENKKTKILHYKFYTKKNMQLIGKKFTREIFEIMKNKIKIIFTPLKTITFQKRYLIKVFISNVKKNSNAYFCYRQKGENKYIKLKLNRVLDDNFEGDLEIPKNITSSDIKLEYYISVNNSLGKTLASFGKESKPYKVTVQAKAKSLNNYKAGKIVLGVTVAVGTIFLVIIVRSFVNDLRRVTNTD